MFEQDDELYGILFKAIVDELYEIPPNGSRVSDLPTATKLEDTDLFVTEKDETNSISYIDLLSNIQNDFTRELSLNTMAYENALKYSKRIHSHDFEYTMLSSFPVQTTGNTVLVISTRPNGAIPIEQAQVLSIMIPEYDHIELPEPEIGSLRFQYCGVNGQKADNTQLITSPDFDGWVYPNGDELIVDDVVRFQKALSLYGRQINRIKLPDLHGFFKPSMSKVESIETQIPGRLSMVKHIHTVDPISVSGSITTNENASWKSYGGALKAGSNASHVHTGVQTRNEQAELSISLQRQNFPDLSCSYSGDTGSFIPQHVKIPVMMYIGGAVKL